MKNVILNVSLDECMTSLFMQYCAEHNLSVYDPHETGISIKAFSDFVMEYLKGLFETDEEE